LKVCHIASGDGWAGAEVQIAHLLRVLAENAAVEVRAVLLNEGRLANELRTAGVSVTVLQEAKYSFPQLVWKTGEFVRRQGSEILHSHRYKENLIGACLVKARVARFHVRTQHGRPEPFASYRGLKQALLHGVDRFVAKHATDRVISVSQDLMSYFPVGANVVVIRNGLDLRNVRSDLDIAAAKRRLGLSERGLVIGSLGRLEPVKRIDICVETARRVRAEWGDVEFLIAGSGSSEAAIREMVKADSAFRVLGYRDDTYDVLRAMDLFLLTSDHEGLPMVLLEAQALGVPVVSRRVGGVPEVIESGKNGALIDSADPAVLASECLALLRDTDRRNEMSEAALKRAMNFDVRTTAARVADLYNSLVSDSVA